MMEDATELKLGTITAKDKRNVNKLIRKLVKNY